ncbi:Ig-like domain-containing protein [Emticicia fontis]
MKSKPRFFKTLSVILLIFISGLLACKNEEDDIYALNTEEGIKLGSIISLINATSGTMEADGVTPHTFTIQINKEAADDAKEIQVSTSLGVFANGKDSDTVLANSSGLATFSLTSIKPGKAKITAKIKTFSIENIVEFIPALPNDLAATADSYVIKPTQSITVTTSLTRKPFKGQVSDPVEVFYRIIPASSSPHSLVYPLVSRTEDKKTTITVANPFLLEGDFILEVKTFDPSGKPIIAPVNFKIEP